MPNFRHRLTRAQQRVYDRSNAVSSVSVQATPALRHAVAALPAMLQSAERGGVEQLAQRIADEIAAALRVARVRILVAGTRPSNARGELHGLYTAAHNGRAATIKLWMTTAKRQQVVAFKTFLRTLLHEICHHLDHTLLKLPDSFHTDGFYQRESSLFYRVGGAQAATPPPRAATPAAEHAAAFTAIGRTVAVHDSGPTIGASVTRHAPRREP
jgi:hypothetical protein